MIHLLVHTFIFFSNSFFQLKKPHWRREVDVMEIENIRTEYEVVQCRLRLLKHSADKYKRTGKASQAFLEVGTCSVCFLNLLFHAMNPSRMSSCSQ